MSPSISTVSLSFSPMVSSSSLLPFFFFFTTRILSHSTYSKPNIACFNSIFSFGDSLTDTRNYLINSANLSNAHHFPYGESYFHRPTSRHSDDRLILDFIAEAIGVPRVPPFLEGMSGGDFWRGVNFAVASGTEIESGFFWKRGISIFTNYSLGVQTVTDCDKFIVGEIGGNDYNIPLLRGEKLDEIISFVPRIIDAIGSAINDLIELGANTLVVPRYLPDGCIPGLLATFQCHNKKDYDPQTGCIKWVNQFAEYHNRKLLQELDRQRQRHPTATIIYADYCNAASRIFRNPCHFGFGHDYLSACCGGGGPYNFNSSVKCRTEKANLCSDPSKFICWDGMHFTEAANRAIADALITGPFAIPLLNHTCHIRSM